MVVLGLVAGAGCGAVPAEEATATVETTSGDTVTVTLSTTAGDIVLELYRDQAPTTVENFLRYVDGGHFNGASFYRVVRPENNHGTETMQLIQGGLLGDAMSGGDGDVSPPFPPIAHETTEMTGLRHVRGVISMARGEPGTASSEFFILVTDAPELDFGGLRNPDGQGFAAFGRVIDGMEVVDAIHKGPSDAPTDIEFIKGQILEEPVEITAASRNQGD